MSEVSEGNEHNFYKLNNYTNSEPMDAFILKVIDLKSVKKMH